MMGFFEGERTAGTKLALAIAMGFLLSVPLFSIYLLNYGRQSQSREAESSITAGWGAAQTMSGPLIVVPYRTRTNETLVDSGHSVTRTSEVTRVLTLAPEILELGTDVRPEIRRRSIYEAIVYDAKVSGTARFILPPDLAQSGVDPSQLDLAHAELRFGLSDPRGLGANPSLNANGAPLRPQPGGTDSSVGKGFFSWLDASRLTNGALVVDYAFDFRGNAGLNLAARAGDTRWTVRSSWPSPSFGGDFLPGAHRVSNSGFIANYRIGNLALGRSLVSTDAGASAPTSDTPPGTPAAGMAQISLVQPVDLYSQVDRATKYGFLFIGFTFLALLMFDVVGGIRISPVEYLLTGAALVLFFVLLLAFAEVIGFSFAYVLASAAIAGLNTAYCAAILASWRRASLMGGLLAALYATLYILLSLEAFSLLIGSLLLFAALAAVMYATRRIDWGLSRTQSAKA